MAREQLEFVKVDVTTLPTEVQEAWAMYLEVKAILKDKLQVVAPAGKRVQFVDKYGELKIALQTIAAPKAEKRSLAEFLAAQQANGRAA